MVRKKKKLSSGQAQALWAVLVGIALTAIGFQMVEKPSDPSLLPASTTQLETYSAFNQEVPTEPLKPNSNLEKH